MKYFDYNDRFRASSKVQTFLSKFEPIKADVYALFIGIYIFGETFDYLYLIAFFVILAALIGRFHYFVFLGNKTCLMMEFPAM